MLKNVKLRWLSMLCIAALALGGLENSALAQKEPFKVTGGGEAPGGLSVFGDDSPFNVSGTATHLGKYSGDEGIAIVTSIDEDLSGTFKGSFVFVAANGDRLVCAFGDTEKGAESDGIFFAVPAGAGLSIVFCAEFIPITSECTGRFEGVIGSFTLLAMTESFDPTPDPCTGFTPAFDFTWEGDGWLEFDRGKE